MGSALRIDSLPGVVAKPLCEEFGVDVEGFQLDELADRRNDVQIDWIRKQLDTQLLLRFRGQKLTQEQLMRFVGYFGKLAPLRTQGSSHKIAEGIKLITNERDPTGKAVGDPAPYELGWHTDGSYMRTPTAYTALYCITAPKIDATKTYWMNLETTFRRLPDENKRALAAMKMLHYHPKNPTRYAPEDAPMVGACRAIEQPVVRKIQGTGKVTLFLPSTPDSPLVVDGERWSQERSAEFIAGLYEQGERLGEIWQTALADNDLVFWDNRVMAHKRDNVAPDLNRVLWHSAVSGEEPIAFVA